MLDSTKVYVVGIGPGSYDYIIPKAIKTMEDSDVILCFKRVFESVNFIKTPILIVNKLQDIIEIINKNIYKNISIAASGDPLFYGITNYIKKNFNGIIEIIPGITSLQYFSSKLGVSWNNAYIGSMHGREEDFYKLVEEYKISMWLTDKKNSPKELCKKLYEKNIKCRVYVGENLSYENEKITIGNPKELSLKEFSDLSVIIIEGGKL